ncbi:hypothetical protein MNBD_ALPHA11-2333 [hydrothermal vent metagenome]|uniref:Uncharacterized protein n=1 Tax=hydrothermal vent metagenome TaxID=652676 RepID=A0A3B0UR86_9ZZZZ
MFAGSALFICLAARLASPVTLKKLLAKLSLRQRAALAAALVPLGTPLES